MKKIVSIIICMLVCLSSILIIPDNLKVEASGGSGEGSNDIGLDYDFMWNITKKLSNVIFNKNVYPPNENILRKGRCFGTDGDRWAANYLNQTMDEELGLENTQELLIGPIEKLKYKDRYYSSKIEVIDCKFEINNTNYSRDNNGLPCYIPKNETFPIPSGFKHKPISGKMTYNYTFNGSDNIRVLSQNMTERSWPLGSFSSRTYYNVSCSAISTDDFNKIIGKVTYVESNESMPAEQEITIFMIEEVDGCEDKLDNVTNATGVILIHNETTDYCAQNLTNRSFNALRASSSTNNLTIVIEELKNGTKMFADNLLDNETITFTECCTPSWWPDYNFFILCNLSDSEGLPWWQILKTWAGKSYYAYFLNHFPVEKQYKCKGFIIHDYFPDNYWMLWHNRDWFRIGLTGDPDIEIIGMPYFGLPMFSINQSVGEWLVDNSDDSNTTIIGYLNQSFKNEKHNGPPSNWKPGIEAYNVIGNITIDKSPDDKIVIISNRYDGWWAQTPGDSGLGGGIVLAIAKYFKDYNITPKYNLSFLMTTGEEFAFRGAQHYSDKHEDDKVEYFIGADQLGQNVTDSVLRIDLKYESTDDIVRAIWNETKYYERSNKRYDINTTITPNKGGGTEASVWKQREGHDCKTICFHKNSKWNFHHRTGRDFTKGDVLNGTVEGEGIDRNDANLTLELVWNITKYFTVNPDCWFDSYSETKLDSPDDGDYLDDSIKATFTVKTILPHDLVMVNATLKNVAEDFVSQTFMNFTVNSSGRQESVTLTIPENEPPGDYTLFLELYNSTGRINEIVQIGDVNYNDTTPNPVYCPNMYPFNYDKFPSEITDVSATSDPVGFGFGTTISANVSDNASSVNNVSVNITYPNNNWGNFTMTNTGGVTYEYVFSDTWLVGQYNFTIWTLDNSSNSNSSSGHSFNVSAQADISVCTIKNNYSTNEIINITDPPRADIGYELLDDNKVLHIWNNHNSYYFNTSNGIQFTNHYNEYWSHNVLMLGYYSNDEWNLIYRADELNGFNKDITTDNETYVNATLWKDLNYQGYDFRLAIKYHLSLNDIDLTVIPYIKNLGDAIPYDLAFGWKIKDIKIADTYENDMIRVYNGTDWISYYLDQTLNNTYTDMDYNTTFYLEGHNEDEYFMRTLYLRWNHTLDYLLRVKSRTGQYNAPVTLFIKIGTLNENQEKYTMMNWLDSDKWLGVNGWNYHSSCGYTGPDTPWGALNGTGVWAHMTTENHWLVIDLNETYNIKKIRGRSETSDDPTAVDIYISNDPSDWGSAVHTGITTWQDTSTWAEVDIPDTAGRYINISITDTEGMAGDNYLLFGKLPTPMTILDVYGEKVSTTSYYFNSYDNNQIWVTSPGNMVDGNISTYASTSIDEDLELCNGNTCPGINQGNIIRVELRVYGYYATNQRDIILIPVFGGVNPGSEYTYETISSAGWSPWFNITDDNQAPGTWDWTDIMNLDCDVIAELKQGGGAQFTLYCSKVEVRVVYYPGVQITNPYPADGSMGICLTPRLNITVSHPAGNTMNITWLSNSSGSWQVFGTNNSVGNGTYRQIFSNATENGKWWYWMVNVSDGESYYESSVYKFYTGYQSKIENTGSTSIKGYLLMQVQYYNTSTSTWVVVHDTVNETIPRTIHWDDPNTSTQHILALDTIFNGLVNTVNLSSYGNGTYRIYAAFRDPDNNILKCDDETELMATYEFTVTFE